MPRTLSENRPPSTALSPALSWLGDFRRNYTTTKTSAHSPVEPGGRALVSYLMRNRNEEQIDIAAAITASFALWVAVSPQTAMDKETTSPNPNTCSNRTPGAASGANRTSDTTDNRDGRSRWNDSRACLGGS